MHRWVCLLALLTLPACTTSVVVAEKHEEPDARASALDGADSMEKTDAAPEILYFCGHARCMDRTVTAMGVTVPGFPCCADVERSICGVAEFTQCIPLGQEGHLDSACSSFQVPALGNLPGCCRPDGTCGVYERQIGFGCAQVPFLPALTNSNATCTYSPSSSSGHP